MKFRNESDKTTGFYDGSRHWTFNPNEVRDVPDEHAWRAKAHGLSEVKEKAVVKPKSVKPAVKKKKR